MKLGSLVVFSVVLLTATCEKSGEKTIRTYEVRLTEDKVVFRGIDQPHITNELPGDSFINPDKGNRFNASKRERTLTETRKANAALKSLLSSVDTETLIKSIRWDHQGDLDYQVTLEGNHLIGAELASRRPIPDELVPQPDPEEGLYQPVVGRSAPPLGTFEEFLDYTKEMEARHRETDQSPQ